MVCPFWLGGFNGYVASPELWGAYGLYIYLVFADELYDSTLLADDALSCKMTFEIFTNIAWPNLWPAYRIAVDVEGYLIILLASQIFLITYKYVVLFIEQFPRKVFYFEVILTNFI